MNNECDQLTNCEPSEFLQRYLADSKYLHFFKKNATIEILWVLHEETTIVIKNSHINYGWLNRIKIYLD